MADSLEERARRFALSRMDDWGVKGGRLTGSDLTRAWLAGYRAAVEDAARVAKNFDQPGPGGIDISGGIPPEIYIAIGRGRYDDAEYDLAADVASGVAEQIAQQIRALVAPSDPATPE